MSREVNWQTVRHTIRERTKFMLNNELLSDVKFVARKSDGESKQVIPAHKFVLSIGSPVFEAMFYGELAETRDSIELPDCEYESLLEFFRYMYTDQVNLNGSNVMGVLYLAGKYMVPSLADKCLKFLQDNLDPSNVFNILPVAEKYEEKNLMDRCWKVIDKRTREALQSDGFLAIERSLLEAIVHRETLAIKEADIFVAVDLWATRQCEKQGLSANGESKRRILGEQIIRAIHFPPNKVNISLNFLEMKNESLVGSNLDWIVDMVSSKGKETPQTIIFCKTFHIVSYVLSFLLVALGGKAFVDTDNQGKVSLIGICHTKRWAKKKHHTEDMKRVLIATCFQGVHIDCPDVRYVVQYTPPNSSFDMMQLADLGGRDGLQAHCIVYYTRQQLSQCNKDVENAVSCKDCQRKELYSYFSDSDSSIEPGHKCCSNCRKGCKCDGDKCGDEQPFLTHEVGKSPPTSERVRELNERDLLDVKLTMKELQERYSPIGRSLFHPESTHGFSDQVIENILQHAPFIFSPKYLYKHISVLSIQQVMDVMEAFQELFEDINDFEEQMEELFLIRREVSQVEGYVLLESFMSYGLSDDGIWDCKDHCEDCY